jgi:flagellar hook-basal body complex protein FliE
MDALSALRFSPLNAGTLPGLNLDNLPGAKGAGGVKIPTQELASIPQVGPSPAAITSSGAGGIGGVGGSPFSDMLGGFVREVNAKQAAAGDAVEGVLTGQNVPLHQAMIAMEEANVSFQLMVEVRNKLLESYQELMRMQI